MFPEVRWVEWDMGYHSGVVDWMWVCGGGCWLVVGKIVSVIL